MERNHRRTPECIDRVDLITRVFNLKLESLLQELKDGIFGTLKGLVRTIEFRPIMVLRLELIPGDVLFIIFTYLTLGALGNIIAILTRDAQKVAKHVLKSSS